MSGRVEKSRAFVELFEESRKYKASKPKAENGLNSDALPLHDLIPEKGANKSATLILFKKGGVKLNVGSKVQLFANNEKTDLI